MPPRLGEHDMTTITKIIAPDAKLNLIDELGVIKAQIAELQAQEKFLVKRAKEELGTGSFDGDLFTASVIKVEDRQIADPQAMEAKLRSLGIDNRWFSKNQKTVTGYTQVRVSARKTS